MSRDLNLVIVIGRLVRDPEIKYTTSGVPVAKFSIANNTSFTQNNERKEYVNYFDVNVWGNQAINCEKYLKKGSQIAIEGHLRQNRWTDQTTGKTQSKIEITANSVQFLTPASSGVTNSGNNSQFQNIASSKQQQQQQQQNNNIIPDPWNDTNNNNNSPDFYDSGYSDSNFGSGGDDDIPF